LVSMLKNRSLRFKLNLYILTGTILVALVIFTYYYSISRRLLLDNVEETARHLTLETVNQVESVFRSSGKIPENLACVIEMSQVDEKGLLRFLREVVNRNDEVFGSTVSFEPYAFFSDRERYGPYYFKGDNGLEFASLADPTYNYFLRDWYQIPKEIKRPIWSEPYFDEGGGDIVMATYSVPFYWDKDGEHCFRGIITIDISLEWLQHIFSQITIYQSGYGFLISPSGKYLIHPQQDFVMNESIFDVAEVNNDQSLREVGRSMVRGQTGFMNITDPVSGRDSYLYFAPFPSSGYSMGIVIPKVELYADMARLNKVIAVIGAVGLLVLFGVISFISTRITKPMRELSKAAEYIGQGDFSAPLPAIETGDEIGHLTASFGHMQQALKEYIANLKATTAAKEKIEGELRIAHDIQMSIIPKTFPPFPDRSDLDIFGILEPAKAVGGDLYDFFLLDDDHLCAVIGDVSGKGVPASLFMAVTRTLLRAKAMNMKGLTPGKIVASMNNDLCTDNTSAMFVTFFLLILDLRTSEIQYCNAGHNPPFLMTHDGQLESIAELHGLPLGIIEGEAYGTATKRLRPGDKIVLYTDGVTEAENVEQQLFEENRLAAVLRELGGKADARTVTLRIKESVTEFVAGAEQSDDLTLLILSHLGPAKDVSA